MSVILHDKPALFRNERGFGLIAAIFVIVILALFGTLMARYIMTSSVTSAEDYLWTQTYYSASSAINLRILAEDEGGNWTTWSTYPQIAGAAVSETSASFQPPGQPSFIRLKASINQISRELELKYIK